MYRTLTPSCKKFSGFYTTFPRRCNTTILIPFRIFSILLYLTALICVAGSSDDFVLIEFSDNEVSGGGDRVDLRRSVNVYLVVSFMLLFVTCWGIFTGRTLRSGTVNFMHCCSHTTAAIALIVIWCLKLHLHRMWHVFYAFGAIPTAMEVCALCGSYYRGLDSYL
ncbi:hypothetical protein, conserved [Trypanosoma brucei gambiense DAL972]|uniref:Uncharacterized protein n=2 Tax=Trypanosoma brucei TaxID=5691 RepID=C9ZQT6_TRYB9|nr:hypothetical protein, conserved [Trypanosoma brucei gambiense DAL972]RHW71870.1 transmembrane protein [Trypanosoma brucei equiperdum]CBH11766.1 hypothetical protein, conserved [Trypanosoma brucei gambiense DAL972]|eukprot:XP_011774051.1 hypothetical protein, conserved [Trypanosoma brucei gambiense DAL972]